MPRRTTCGSSDGSTLSLRGTPPFWMCTSLSSTRGRGTSQVHTPWPRHHGRQPDLRRLCLAAESEEMRPEWFPVNQVPFDQMWYLPQPLPLGFLHAAGVRAHERHWDAGRTIGTGSLRCYRVSGSGPCYAKAVLDTGWHCRHGLHRLLPLPRRDHDRHDAAAGRCRPALAAAALELENRGR